VDPVELIEVTPDTQHRRRLRQRWRRIVIPVACVIMMLGAILVIATFSYQHNRRDALALSDDLLRELQRRIATEVKGYLAPAADMARLAAGVLRSQAFGTDFPALTEMLAMHVLENYPQLVTVDIADTKGNFLMPKRMPDGSIHTKRIERTDAATRVTWRRRNPQGESMAVEHADHDDYDPRVRPWYRGAVSGQKLYWSDIYIFFTDQKPGVTASLPIIADNGELRGVLGLDIDLEQLSAFLASLQIGRSGRAMIIDETGRLVAYPDLTRLFKRVGEDLQPVKLDDLGDPVLTRAFNHFRIEGYGHRTLDVDHRRYISTASSLHATIGRHWSLFIVVPEDDFVGFVTRNNRQALAMSLVAELHRVYLLAFGCEALLAVPIVNHGTTIGSVWFEDERRATAWSPETRTFARAIASMLALRLTAATRVMSGSPVVAALSQQRSDATDRVLEATRSSVGPTGAAGAASPGFVPRRGMRTTAIADDRASAFMERLATRGLDRQTMGAHVYTETTVLVVQFTDPLALAERPDDEAATSVVDHLVRHLEDLAAAHRIEYLKIMNAEFVCAAGFDDRPDHGVRVLADVALDLQERCVRLFADIHTRMEFRLGMDTGGVIGSSVGRGEGSYNLWGEAVRAAQWMAETSMAGGIQVTASTYRRLRDSYLFKVRGTYYLQDVGELSTYIITGRI